MSIFSYESRFSRVFLRFADACFLNLLWFAFSLPIVTIGASTTALYTVMLKIAENSEGNVAKQFFAAFKLNFKQATVIWLILLALGALIGGDIYVVSRLREAATGPVAVMWTLLLALAIVFAIIYAIEFIWVFPLVAKVENDTRSMLVNALLIGVRYLFSTLSVFAVHFVMAVVVIRFFTPALILGEGLVALLSSYLMSPVLRACTQQPGAKASPEAEDEDGDA